jgi:hypothetical protein
MNSIEKAPKSMTKTIICSKLKNMMSLFNGTPPDITELGAYLSAPRSNFDNKARTLA